MEYLEGAHLYRADALCSGESGTLRKVRASREVILAGGAFNTPQLLQLSGIGPADLLRRHDIPVRVDLPGVGANLQDRYEITVVLRMNEPFASFEGATLMPPGEGEEPDLQFQQWRQGGGVYTTNGAVMSFIKRSRPELLDPDLFLFGLVTDFQGYYPGYSKRIQKRAPPLHLGGAQGDTRNRRQRRASARPTRATCRASTSTTSTRACERKSEDLDAVVHAVEFIRGITKGYGERIEEEEAPGKQMHSREDLEEFVRNQAWGHHASCTCKIGTDDDPMAVLDCDFQGARHPRPAGRRRVGLPAHPGPVHRVVRST